MVSYRRWAAAAALGLMLLLALPAAIPAAVNLAIAGPAAPAVADLAATARRIDLVVAAGQVQVNAGRPREATPGAPASPGPASRRGASKSGIAFVVALVAIGVFAIIWIRRVAARYRRSLDR